MIREFELTPTSLSLPWYRHPPFAPRTTAARMNFGLVLPNTTVVGILKGFDALQNLVLDDVKEEGTGESNASSVV